VNVPKPRVCRSHRCTSVISATAAAPPRSRARPTASTRSCTSPAYGESKRRGELAVASAPLPWTIVRPPVVYGPGDAATRVLFRQVCVPFTAVPPASRPLSVIHADDVVDALLACLRVRPAGAVLPLDGPQRTDTHALLRAIGTACGRRVRLLPVPLLAARAAAAACDAWGRMRGTCGFFNGDKVRELAACGWVADGEPARALLGFTPRIALADGLAAVARAEGFARATATAAR
jgi:nucleoside-diphosphate-sugar epimerase